MTRAAVFQLLSPWFITIALVSIVGNPVYATPEQSGNPGFNERIQDFKTAMATNAKTTDGDEAKSGPLRVYWSAVVAHMEKGCQFPTATAVGKLDTGELFQYNYVLPSPEVIKFHPFYKDELECRAVHIGGKWVKCTDEARANHAFKERIQDFKTAMMGWVGNCVIPQLPATPGMPDPSTFNSTDDPLLTLVEVTDWKCREMCQIKTDLKRTASCLIGASRLLKEGYQLREDFIAKVLDLSTEDTMSGEMRSLMHVLDLELSELLANIG